MENKKRCDSCENPNKKFKNFGQIGCSTHKGFCNGKSKQEYVCGITGEKCIHQDYKNMDCYNKNCENVQTLFQGGINVKEKNTSCKGQQQRTTAKDN